MGTCDMYKRWRGRRYTLFAIFILLFKEIYIYYRRFIYYIYYKIIHTFYKYVKVKIAKIVINKFFYKTDQVE